MICLDSGPGVFAETLEISANLTSVRKVLHHLLMRMTANTLLSVSIPRAGLVRGRRGWVGSRQDSHHFPGPDEPGLQAGEILHYLLPRLEAV
jgi:hypothetical protein